MARTFNSLYGIHPKGIYLILEIFANFQFPLWDTYNIAQYDWGIGPLSIPFMGYRPIEIILFELKGLSIPFMGYRKTIYFHT